MTTRPSETLSTLTNEACLGPHAATAAANRNPARCFLMTPLLRGRQYVTLDRPNARPRASIYERGDLFPSFLRRGAASGAASGAGEIGGCGAAGAMRWALRSSSSSRLLGQSSLSSRDRLRSASSRPSVWQVGQ